MSRDNNEMSRLANEMAKAISTEVEQRYIEDEAKLQAVLIENGWRKASDVAEEIFAEIESCIWSETHYGDSKLCFEINSAKYAELKKKYESENDDG